VTAAQRDEHTEVLALENARAQLEAIADEIGRGRLVDGPALTARLAKLQATITASTTPAVQLELLRDLAPRVVAQSKIPELDYGFTGLNAKAPLPMRCMATLLAPTGAGKTSLAMAIGAHHSRFAGTPKGSQGPTVHLAFELTPEQLAARRAAQRSSQSWRRVLGGALTAVEIEQLLDGEHYYVARVPRGANYLDVAQRVLDEAQRRSGGIPLLIPDYLQRIRGDGSDPRVATSRIVDDIVELTESRDMFTLLVSKGSRASSRTMRDGKTRGEAHVDGGAETSAIEYGSAAIMAITYENREGEQEVDVRVAIPKGRYEATGSEVGMRFDGASGQWTELVGLPPTKAEREAEVRILATLKAVPAGFPSFNEAYHALKTYAADNKKGDRGAANKAWGRLTLPGGPIARLADGQYILRAEAP
jgi:hypothetical protein